MIKVGLVYRKPNQDYFSIENVFRMVSSEMMYKVFFEEYYAPSNKVSLMGILKNILFFRGRNADIYHITGDIHYAALALPSSKVILTIHDCNFLQNPSKFKRWILKKIWLDLPVKHSTYVTTISEATRKEIINNAGCSPDKVIVIADPMDRGFTYFPKLFNTEKPIILQVGTWPNKNLERVITALKGITCEFIIVGKLTYDQENLLHASGINYTTRYLLSRDELINCYRNSDIVMFPTLFEGFGLPILEAQATGRPIITSNISPMKEVAGINACLVDPLSEQAIREAVERIISDASYRQKLVDFGLQNIKKYSADVIAEQYFDVYKEIYEKINAR